ncbi:hypothetical protein [Romboutsia sp.]|uniref:hypothetical protein n=1 Tax=Romboutsia sp. TaxID=1965302 RepID=UPI002BC0DE63|nr:hypothetical protein [Romboutsia sp.]HSQ89978.1 hypothetical protein [Romboutsia sp.]
MEKAYKFIQTTLLGLMVGVLIILLYQFKYWANDIKMTLRKSIVYQNNEYVKQYLENSAKKRPTREVPNTPKYII